MRARAVPGPEPAPLLVDLPPVSSFRTSLERASLPAVTWLSRLPRVVPFLAVVVLMVLGIVIQPWGWVFIAITGLFLAWMLFLGWPRLSNAERMMRVAVLVLVAAVTLTRAFPQG